MLFEIKAHEHQITFIDHHFQLPPDIVFSLRVNKEEAIRKAQLSEAKWHSVWHISKEWRLSDEEWKPTWKVQLRGSPRIYYVDVRNGTQETEDVELGAATEFFIRGQGNLPLSHESDLTPLPLPEIRAITPTTQVVSADEKGFLQTELPLAVLLFSLKNKVTGQPGRAYC